MKITINDFQDKGPEGVRGPGCSSELPLLVDRLLAQRHPHLGKPSPSPDSAIHSAYSYSSPAQSPVTSRSSHGKLNYVMKNMFGE